MKTNLIKSYILVSLLFAFYGWLDVSAQVPNYTNRDSLLRTFDQHFLYLDSLIFGEERHMPTAITISPIPEEQLNRDVYDDALFDVEEARMGTLTSKTGLSLSGQAYYRFYNRSGIINGSSSIEDDSEDSYSIPYDVKAQIELRWSIFGADRLKMKGRKNAIRIQTNIDQSIYDRELLSYAINNLEKDIQNQHDEILVAILKVRMKNLDLMLQRTDLLDVNNTSINTETMNLIKDRADIERQIISLIADYDGPILFPRFNPATVRIDTVSLMKFIDEENASLNELELRAELARQQSENQTYWSSVELAPFARLAFYFEVPWYRSGTLDLGVSVKFPITREASRQRKVYASQQRINEVKRSLAFENIRFQITEVVKDLDKLNQAMSIQWVTTADLHAKLKVHSESYRRLPNYNRLSRLRDYEIFLHELERTVSLQFKINENLLRLQSLMGNGRTILDFCSVNSLGLI